MKIAQAQSAPAIIDIKWKPKSGMGEMSFRCRLN